MVTVQEAIDESIREVDRARKRVSNIKSKQVRSVDDVAALKATADAWFRTHRPVIINGSQGIDPATVDECYTTILNATAKYAAKTTYLHALRGAKGALIQLRAEVLVDPMPNPAADTDDLAPDFSPLAGNRQMQEILVRRWHECAKCVRADAHLAAIVMMGGLLEALFVARANKMTDRSKLVAAVSVPRDKTGKPVPYQEWMLDAYIQVGYEVKWITSSAKSVAHVLKEYRNFVHPAKELRYGVSFGHNDSSMCWQITKSLARQLLLSA